MEFSGISFQAQILRKVKAYKEYQQFRKMTFGQLAFTTIMFSDEHW